MTCDGWNLFLDERIEENVRGRMPGGVVWTQQRGNCRAGAEPATSPSE